MKLRICINSFENTNFIYTGVFLTLALSNFIVFYFHSRNFRQQSIPVFLFLYPFFLFFSSFFSLFTFPFRSFHISFIWLTACTRPIKGILTDKYNAFYVSLIIILLLLHAYILFYLWFWIGKSRPFRAHNRKRKP